MAGAAIGVSHLVQSTRAGADFGFQLLPLVLLTLALKYPFFEIGHRFSAITGDNLLVGYRRLGRWYLASFLVVNLVTSFASVAAVTLVTAALCQNLGILNASTSSWAAVLAFTCIGIIWLGSYGVLDKIIKLLMAVLFVTTLIAVMVAFQYSPMPTVASNPFQIAHLPFILALLGWMPAPIELSVWQSLWVQEKAKQQVSPVLLKDGLVDFRFGYFLTLILAAAFLALGALVMAGSGQSFANSPAQFAGQVIDLYTANLGAWSWGIVSVAAFATMYSTTLTLIDAYPRSLAVGFAEITSKKSFLSSHLFWMILTVGMGLTTIFLFANQLKSLVDVVTILAFLTGPFFAYLNLKLIFSAQIPKSDQPGWMFKACSVCSMIFLIGFAGFYIYSRI